ncbi:hypothetical protein Bhyg_02963, partial [Pseudolycoriella hygida]
MKESVKLIILGFVLQCFVTRVICLNDESSTTETPSSTTVSDYNKQVAENRLSTQLLALIDHFHQEDPLGLPGAPVKAGIQLDQMNVKGNYTLSSFFTKAEGPFTIVLRDVFVKGNASLAVERDGMIRTKDIEMDISFKDMAVDFQNLGFFASIFQSFINSAPTLVFDAIKPLLLSEAYVQISKEIDSNIEKASGGHRFPNSISPLDMAIADARKKVRSLGYDPYKIKDYNHTVGLFEMKMMNTWITGISSFYRVGEIVVGVDNLTMSIVMEIGTQQILGASQWEVSFGSGMITRAGNVQFTIDHLNALFEINQSLDLRKRPQIKDLQLELGNIQVRCDGAGTLDYVTEFLVNILPNLLRYQIMDALENPAKLRIQQMMNKIDVESVIKEKYSPN